MKHFQLAIASIVDANTGHGFTHGNGIDYREEELRSRAIRSKSVHAFFGALGNLLRVSIASYRERARQRKAVEALAQLSDYYLEDIGLTRGDVAAVKLGQASLADLNTDRRARLAVKPLEVIATDKLDTTTGRSAAANEADFAQARCA
jgi:uncharacterized protein YjiS (DUF1127 family)